MGLSCDFLVLGSGLAGLSFALKVADHGQVMIVSKTKVEGANTPMAQGGIAAVMSGSDSFASHVQDTLLAGAGLCNEAVVRATVEQAPERIQDLLGWGIRFDLGESGELALTREGGHSHRRIVHVQDHTGHEIHQQLLLRAHSHHNIVFLENTLAIDLILNRDVDPRSIEEPRCLGAHVLDLDRGASQNLFARVTVLATGGAGKVYQYTSNWAGATGDGIAMAFRAGARVANLEFMQFHPTCLYHPQSRNFLITEALRGEGAVLINREGERFAARTHPLAELAPRDIVARSIDAEMKRTGAECVFLDISGKQGFDVSERFPVIFKTCLDFGIDIRKAPIPVVPAAHYLCGGVLTDLSGRTDLHGLLAVGETAMTGLHGANRLASNSLLECLVTSHNAAQWVLDEIESLPSQALSASSWSPGVSRSEDEMVVVSHAWEEIRRLMWNYVGIVRSNRRLLRAQSRLRLIAEELGDVGVRALGRMTQEGGPVVKHRDLIELRNIALVAGLTVQCALKRQESRGIHFNLDHAEDSRPETARDSILAPGSINHF
jgi:L-aspartate oxidase